jgi:uncharacterized protein (TIGR02688 family)
VPEVPAGDDGQLRRIRVEAEALANENEVDRSYLLPRRAEEIGVAEKVLRSAVRAVLSERARRVAAGRLEQDAATKISRLAVMIWSLVRTSKRIAQRTSDSDYWAELNNFGNKFVHVPTDYVRNYERLLTGWAQVDMRFEYDEESKGKNPFWIDKLTPIQIAAFGLDEYQNLRSEFTTDEWIDLMLRSMGYEPAEMTRRLKFLFLTRLIPLCERNYNLVELGPRGTGKSYVVQEISPYAALMTGPTTVANLFGHMGGRTKGLVQIWDVVGFDEVADLQKMPKEVITTMKTYCESRRFPARPGGSIGRGKCRILRKYPAAGGCDGSDGAPVRADAAGNKG